MAVIDENEIQLNSIRYPIQGKVRPILSSNFAPKQVVGAYTKDSNPEVDSWVISDNRGGILAEEMDEERQANRAYWSTCNLGFLGHILLPRLATKITPPAPRQVVGFDTFTDTLSDWASETNIDDDDTTTDTVGSVDSDAWSGYLQCSLTTPITICGFRIRPETAFNAATFNNLQVDTSPNNSDWTSRLDMITAWATSKWIYVYTGAITLQDIRIRVYNDGVSPYTFSISELQLIETTGGTAETGAQYCNHGGELYYAAGENLYKLNDAGTAWHPMAVFDSNITALTSSVGSELYVHLGDSNGYYHLTSDDELHEVADGHGVHAIAWDSKLGAIDSTGQIAFSADPNAASPTWSDKGDIADEGITSNDVNRLGLYRDATGDVQVYASTKRGLYVHDYTNSKWIATEVALPNQPRTGKGFVHWRERCYVSAGLGVLAYQTGQAGTSISSMGLDQDDGLPPLRGGEIVNFVDGFNEFFALVDSTYEGTTSRSTVMAYDGKGWQSWWEAGSDNLHIYTGLVSSKLAYRLWFSAGNDTYYIPMYAGLRNPKKVTTFTYDTAGVHITPWFDANWVGQKLALQFKVFCKDTTADQDVLVEYRIDHATTAIAADGWTTLGTIVAAGDGVETTYTFGSSLGINFKAIQFKFTLGRITTGTTPEYYSPDIQYAVLEYQKIIKPTWGWAFTIDCTNAYAGRTADQMLDAVVTAAELEVLTPFLYKDTTYYVRVKSVEGERLTGDGQKGTYNVLVSKPV